MSTSPESSEPRCETCGAPGTLRHFPGASPTSGVWCDRHLARLRWLHPMGDRGRVVWMALVALAIAMATALQARAQECRGVPARYVHAFVDRRVLVNGQAVLGAEVGVGADGAHALTANYGSAQIGRPGSRTVSYGGRYVRQLAGNGFAACLTGGYQWGRSFRVNLEGTNTNFRIRYNRLSAGAAASYTVRPTARSRLIVYVFPELSLQAESYDQYDRTDWLTAKQSTYPTAVSYGISLAVSRVFARLSRTDVSGGAGPTSHTVVLGGGIAW